MQLQLIRICCIFLVFDNALANLYLPLHLSQYFTVSSSYSIGRVEYWQICICPRIYHSILLYLPHCIDRVLAICTYHSLFHSILPYLHHGIVRELENLYVSTYLLQYYFLSIGRVLANLYLSQYFAVSS